MKYSWCHTWVLIVYKILYTSMLLFVYWITWLFNLLIKLKWDKKLIEDWNGNLNTRYPVLHISAVTDSDCATNKLMQHSIDFPRSAKARSAVGVRSIISSSKADLPRRQSVGISPILTSCQWGTSGHSWTLSSHCCMLSPVKRRKALGKYGYKLSLDWLW